MVWNDWMTAVGTLVLLCVFAVCLTIYGCVKARVNGDLRMKRLELGYPEDGDFYEDVVIDE